MRRQAVALLLVVCGLSPMLQPTCQAEKGGFGDVCGGGNCRRGLNCSSSNPGQPGEDVRRCLCPHQPPHQLTASCADFSVVTVDVSRGKKFLSLTSTIHANQSFSNISLLSVQLQNTWQQCLEPTSMQCRFRSLLPGTLYQVLMKIGYTFQGNSTEVTLQKQAYTRPAKPSKFTTKEDEPRDGDLTLTWPQQGKIARAECLLRSVDGTFNTSSNVTTPACRWNGLPAFTVFRSANVTVFNGRGDLQRQSASFLYVHVPTPSTPRNIRHRKLAENSMAITWDQERRPIRTSCQLHPAAENDTTLSASPDQCLWTRLPFFRPFGRVNITVVNEFSNKVRKATASADLLGIVFFPNVISSSVITSVSDTSVNLTLEDTEDNITVGYYVINSSSSDCFVYALQETCLKPSQIEGCSRGEFLTLQPTNADDAGLEGTRLPQVLLSTPTPFRISLAVSSPGASQGDEEDPVAPFSGGEALQPSSSSSRGRRLLLRVDNLSPATSYEFRLTPCFCNVTFLPGAATLLSPVTTLFVASVRNVSVEDRTTIHVTWDTPPPPSSPLEANISVILTDVTEVEPPGGKTCQDQGNQSIVLCSALYAPGSQVDSCQGSAPRSFWLYSIRVQVETANGSTVSDSEEIQTPSAAPEKVPELQVLTWDLGEEPVPCGPEKLTNRSVACVSWMTLCPRDRNAIIEAYQINITPNQTGRTHRIHCPGGRDTLRVRYVNEIRKCYVLLHLRANSQYNLSVGALTHEGRAGQVSTRTILMPRAQPPPQVSSDRLALLVPPKEVTVIPGQGQLRFVITNLTALVDAASSNARLFSGLIVTLHTQQPRVYNTPRQFINKYPSWGENQSLLANGSGYLVNEAALYNSSDGPVVVVLGDDANCTSKKFCDGKLETGKIYSVWVPTCNEGGCTLIGVVQNVTVPGAEDLGLSESAMAGIAVAVLLGVVLVAVAAIFLAFKSGWASNFYDTTAGDSGCETEALHMNDIGAAKASCPMPLHTLETAIAEKQRDDAAILCQELEDIRSFSKVFLTQTGLLSVNLGKNRYADVIAYDHSRVKLTKDSEGSDYINANYMPGYSHDKEYVATQGPLPFTTPDLWRMVWEHRLQVIVMLTLPKESNKIKCEQYWPDQQGEEEEYEDFVVTNVSVYSCDDYSVTVLSLRRTKKEEEEEGEGERQVMHYHYLKWPDMTADVSLVQPVLQFVSLVRATATSLPSAPVVVHCSAGVGRTGCFICVDYIMQFIKHRPLSDQLDIYAFVRRLRNYRCMMIQTEEQYEFIHQCALVLMEQRRRSGGEGSDDLGKDSDSLQASDGAALSGHEGEEEEGGSSAGPRDEREGGCGAEGVGEARPC